MYTTATLGHAYHMHCVRRKKRERNVLNKASYSQMCLADSVQFGQQTTMSQCTFKLPSSNVQSAQNHPSAETTSSRASGACRDTNSGGDEQCWRACFTSCGDVVTPNKNESEDIQSGLTQPKPLSRWVLPTNGRHRGPAAASGRAEWLAYSFCSSLVSAMACKG